MQPALSRRERKKNETREKIYHTALTLFRVHGFEKTSVDMITNRADVGKGTFYNYFVSKEAVIYRYTREINQEIMERDRERINLMSSTKHKLCFILQRWAEFIQGHPEVGAVIVQEGSSIMARQANGSLEVIMAGIIGAGQAKGEIRQDVASLLLAQSVQAAVVWQLVEWHRDEGAGNLSARFKSVLNLFSFSESEMNDNSEIL